MVWIGGISYSLYLWHWPILAFIRYYTGQYELSFVALLAFLTGSFLLAWFSYRYIETPARKAVGLRQQALKWMLAASVVAIVVTGGGAVQCVGCGAGANSVDALRCTRVDLPWCSGRGVQARQRQCRTPCAGDR